MLSKYFRYVVKKYLFAVLAFLFTITYWISAAGLPTRALVFPKALTWLLIPLFLWNFIESVRGFRKTLASDEPETRKWGCTLHLSKPKAAVTIATLAYIVVMPILGFVSSTALFLAGLSYYLGVRRPLPLLVFTVLYTLSIYIIFVAWLRVRLPDGLLI